MNTARKLLEETIQQLDDEQTQEVLAFVRHLRADSSQTLARLREDASFTVPEGGPGHFSRVEPIRATGVPASEILVGERR